MTQSRFPNYEAFNITPRLFKKILSIEPANKFIDEEGNIKSNQYSLIKGY